MSRRIHVRLGLVRAAGLCLCSQAIAGIGEPVRPCGSADLFALSVPLGRMRFIIA
ncbi:MAG: hypothetical protein ACYT04_62595 [Nostoc sp.]